MRFAGDTGAVHRLRDAGADRIAQDRAAGAVFMIPYVGRKPPAPFRQLDGQPLQDRMQRDVTGLLALARERNGASDQVDVLTADRRNLADPQTGVRAEQDHRPSPPGHPRAEQDGEVLVGRPASVYPSAPSGWSRSAWGHPGAVRCGPATGTTRGSRRGRSPALISTTPRWPGTGRPRPG